MRTSFILLLGKALLVASFATLLLLPLWIVRHPPLLDYPDHLARAFIIIHLKDSAFQFSNFYFTEWGLEPIGGLQESPPIELEARSLHNRAGIRD